MKRKLDRIIITAQVYNFLALPLSLLTPYYVYITQYTFVTQADAAPILDLKRGWMDIKMDGECNNDKQCDSDNDLRRNGSVRQF